MHAVRPKVGAVFANAPTCGQWVFSLTGCRSRHTDSRKKFMSLGTLLLIVLVLMLMCALAARVPVVVD